MKINEILEDISIAIIVLTRVPINNIFSIKLCTVSISKSCPFNKKGAHSSQCSLLEEIDKITR